MYILEIFNYLLRADGSTNGSNQVVESDLPTGSPSLHHSKQQVLQSSVSGKLISLGITTYSNGIIPNHQLPGIRAIYFKVQFILGAKYVLHLHLP